MDKLSKVLGYSSMEPLGRGSSGCISEGTGYATPEDGDVFVKRNSRGGAALMFSGEFRSLEEIYSTHTIRVPKPIKVIPNSDSDSNAYLVMEYIDIGGSRKGSASELGRRLAQLHLHNAEMLKHSNERASWLSPDAGNAEPITKFGFHVSTCCGYFPLNNTWQDEWVPFYTQQRLEPLVNVLLREYGSRQLGQLWARFQQVVPRFFEPLTDPIVPALLHGDLWSGNHAQTDSGPVIYDPASFYGHSEFEFGIMKMFGGFSPDVFKVYHELIPKAPGFEQRVQLYELFHHLNHYKHFGTSYESGTLRLMQKLCSYFE